MISDFAKEKVFWTKRMNLKLVKFIQSKPHIWNPKHSKYTSTEIRDHTYAEFALKYGNEFTGQAVKDRWTNIRSTFANYLRKIKVGRLKREPYTVNWHLWEACQFLLTVNKNTKNKDNKHDDVEYENDEENKDAIFSPDSDMETTSEEDQSEEEQSKTTSFCQNLAQDLAQVFKGVQNDAFGLNNTRNGKIGTMVAKKLSKLDSLEAAQTSQKIMEILLLYDENNPCNPNNYKIE